MVNTYNKYLTSYDLKLMRCGSLTNLLNYNLTNNLLFYKKSSKIITSSTRKDDSKMSEAIKRFLNEWNQ